MDTPRAFLLAVIGALLLLSTALVLPFLQYFLLAVLLAYVLAPLQARLESRTSPRTAAASLVVAATVTVILPLAFVVRTTASEATTLIEQVAEGELTFDAFERPIEQLLGVDVDLAGALRSAVGDAGTDAFGSLLGLFGAVSHALIGLGLTLFLLFYFLKDGDSLLRWLRKTLPLADQVQDDLHENVDRVTRAVLAGHVLVAIVQGVIAGLGLVAVGIPNALFWTAVMVVLSLLPIVGSFLVWGPAVIYLLVGGRPLAAVLLFVYGAVVVGVSDDYLRPVVVDRYAHVNPSLIVIGVLGGIYVIGFMGIFFGPVVIGALRASLDVYRENYGTDAGGGSSRTGADGGDPRASGDDGGSVADV